MDTVYLDRANATWEAFTYTEGRRYFLKYPKGLDLVEIKRHFQKRKFKVVTIVF